MMDSYTKEIHHNYIRKLEALYFCEFSFSITAQWEAGFYWELKDRGSGNTITLHEAIERLFHCAIKTSNEDQGIELLKNLYEQE